MVAAVVASHTTTLEFITSIYVLPMHELFGHFLRSLDRQTLSAIDREGMVGWLQRYGRPLPI